MTTPEHGNNIQIKIIFSRTSIFIIIAIIVIMGGYSYWLTTRWQIMQSEFTCLQEDYRGYSEVWQTENWLYERNPLLKYRQKEIRDIIRYTYIYSKLYNADFYDCISIAVWESGDFKYSNAGTIGLLGEIGYYQIMPGTGALLGYSVEDLKDLEINTMVGIRYLKLQMDNKGWNINKAIGSYNGGSRYYIYETAQQYIKEVAAIKNELIAYIQEHKRN